MQAKLQVQGTGDLYAELVSLTDWLLQEPELRGGVESEPPDVAPDEMGGLEDVLVVALGGGGAVTVLVRSIVTWLQIRGSEISVLMTDASGGSLVLDATGAAAVKAAEMFGGSGK
ncbi:effector-associated constant component EACC1 [Nocardia sp. NPDC004722]